MQTTASRHSPDLRRIEEVLIRMRDGVELAANVYLPAHSERSAFLVSAYPYRKDDIAGAFNEYWRRRFTEAGYGTVLVDCRGTGASRGRASAAATDPQEAADGYDVVEWTAAQPWCSGDVAVWGMSYGGALALATAALRPPHLRAVACAFGYADSYEDSIFPGGCPACLGRFAREAFMLALALTPSARSDAAGRWREVWEERLAEVERHGPESLKWPAHTRRDDYWEALEVEVERIEVPTLLVGGWHDLYPAAMARVYGRLQAPKRMLAGPWLHVSPELADRERIDWLDELVAWWESTLLGDRGGPTPKDSVTYFAEGVGGGWRRSEGWPPAGAGEISLHLGAGGALASEAESFEGLTEYEADPTVGANAGLLDPLGIGVGYPLDQGPDERASVCFTSAPWSEDVELAGSPALELWADGFESSEVMLSAKLSDVAPDGSSTLITRGWTEVSGTPPIRIDLRPTAYRLPAGHRLRLAVAGADFPAVWATGANATIRIHHGGAYPSRVILRATRVDAGAAAATNASPPPPIDPSPELSPWDAGGAPGWTIERDQVEHAVAVTLAGRGALNLPGGARFELEHTARASVARGHPDRAGLEADAQIRLVAPGRETVTVQTRGSHSRMAMAYEGTVWVGDRVTFAHTWESNGGERE